jgi:hypothetical protein
MIRMINPIGVIIARVRKWRDDDLRDRCFLRLLGIAVHGRSRRTIGLLGEFARECADRQRAGERTVWIVPLPYKDYDEIYADMKRLAATFELAPPFPPNVFVRR